LLDGQSHLGVIDDERTAELIAGFLGDLPGARRP
jgi:hypothetical protein